MDNIFGLNQKVVKRPEIQQSTDCANRLSIKDLPNYPEWIKKFSLECLKICGTRCFEKLDELMELYVKEVKKEMVFCATSPNRSSLIATKMYRTMIFFHVYHTDVKELVVMSQWNDHMVELLSLYCQLEMKSALRVQRGKHTDAIVCARIMGAMWTYLENNEGHMIHVLLKIPNISKKFKDIFDPIYRKLLLNKSHRALTEIEYIRNLLAFKLWKRLYSKEDKKTISSLAFTELKPPPSFNTNFRRFTFLPSFLEGTDLHSNLITALFNLENSIQEYFEYVSRSKKNFENDFDIENMEIEDDDDDDDGIIIIDDPPICKPIAPPPPEIIDLTEDEPDTETVHTPEQAPVWCQELIKISELPENMITPPSSTQAPVEKLDESPEKDDAFASPLSRDSAFASPARENSYLSPPTRECVDASPSPRENIYSSPSSTENTSASPSSRDNVYDSSSGREDISASSSNGENAYNIPSSREDVLASPSSRENACIASSRKRTSPSSRENIYTSPPSRQDTCAASSSRENVSTTLSSRENVYATSSTRESVSPASLSRESLSSSSSSRETIRTPPSRKEIMHNAPSTRENLYNTSSSGKENGSVGLPSSKESDYASSSRENGYSFLSSRETTHSAPSRKENAYSCLSGKENTHPAPSMREDGAASVQSSKDSNYASYTSSSSRENGYFAPSTREDVRENAFTLSSSKASFYNSSSSRENVCISPMSRDGICMATSNRENICTTPLSIESVFATPLMNEETGSASSSSAENACGSPLRRENGSVSPTTRVPLNRQNVCATPLDINDSSLSEDDDNNSVGLTEITSTSHPVQDPALLSEAVAAFPAAEKIVSESNESFEHVDSTSNLNVEECESDIEVPTVKTYVVESTVEQTHEGEIVCSEVIHEVMDKDLLQQTVSGVSNSVFEQFVSKQTVPHHQEETDVGSKTVDTVSCDSATSDVAALESGTAEVPIQDKESEGSGSVYSQGETEDFSSPVVEPMSGNDFADYLANFNMKSFDEFHKESSLSEEDFTVNKKRRNKDYEVRKYTKRATRKCVGGTSSEPVPVTVESVERRVPLNGEKVLRFETDIWESVYVDTFKLSKTAYKLLSPNVVCKKENPAPFFLEATTPSPPPVKKPTCEPIYPHLLPVFGTKTILERQDYLKPEKNTAQPRARVIRRPAIGEDFLDPLRSSSNEQKPPDQKKRGPRKQASSSEVTKRRRVGKRKTTRTPTDSTLDPVTPVEQNSQTSPWRYTHI